MGGEKMINKKASGTLGGIIITMILVMGLFYGMYNYIGFNYTEAGIESNSSYTAAYVALEEAQGNLNTDITNIKDKTQEINEADGNILTVAWNGLSGLASTMRLFTEITVVAVSLWNTLLPILTFIPNWVKILIEMAIIIFIILKIIGAFSTGLKT